VRIGGNSFRGDLHTYKIIAKVDDIAVEVSLTGEVPAWRPRTGHWYFGTNDEHEFNWLPAVPQGTVDATYSVAGKSSHASGVGYHDHNWGNALMKSLINHWYWARGQAGLYTVVASYITAEQKYGNAELPVFLLQGELACAMTSMMSKLAFRWTQSAAESSELHQKDRTPQRGFAQSQFFCPWSADRVVTVEIPPSRPGGGHLPGGPPTGFTGWPSRWPLIRPRMASADRADCGRKPTIGLAAMRSA
jgi:hypothetical protein